MYSDCNQRAVFVVFVHYFVFFILFWRKQKVSKKEHLFYHDFVETFFWRQILTLVILVKEVKPMFLLCARRFGVRDTMTIFWDGFSELSNSRSRRLQTPFITHPLTQTPAYAKQRMPPLSTSTQTPVHTAMECIINNDKATTERCMGREKTQPPLHPHHRPQHPTAPCLLSYRVCFPKACTDYYGLLDASDGWIRSHRAHPPHTTPHLTTIVALKSNHSPKTSYNANHVKWTILFTPNQ